MGLDQKEKYEKFCMKTYNSIIKRIYECDTIQPEHIQTYCVDVKPQLKAHGLFMVWNNFAYCGFDYFKMVIFTIEKHCQLIHLICFRQVFVN